MSLVRSVYMKIINNSGCIFANLNKTMQTKQMQRKKHTHIQIETILTRNYILWWKDL